MKKDFLMPDIGEGVVEGQVIAWLKNVGDLLQKDEPVVILMTDKATVEIPTPYIGTLSKHYYRPGDIAKKGYPLFEVEVAGENQKKVAVEVKKEINITPPERKIFSAHKPLASPKARKLAKDLDVALTEVSGSGKVGNITPDDLKKHLAKARDAPLPHLEHDEEIPILGIQKLMFEKMEQAKQQIPHFSLFNEADVTRLIELKEKMQVQAKENNISLTYMPFFIRALSLVLTKYPELNSSVDKEHGTLILHKVHNIGIAMNTELGLIVPVLKNVQEMDLETLIYAYALLKDKARVRKLTASDMKEGTCTISNFGAYDKAHSFATPIIHYPETCILAVGRISQAPKVIHNDIAIRNTLHCSWSFDHRVIDGAKATEASNAFLFFLENPAYLL